MRRLFGQEGSVGGSPGHQNVVDGNLVIHGTKALAVLVVYMVHIVNKK